MTTPALFSTLHVILSGGFLVQCKVSAEFLYDHTFRNPVFHFVKYKSSDTFFSTFLSAFLTPLFSTFLKPLIDQDIIP